MQPTITSEVVVAYAQCPRKAYLLLFNPEQGVPHEYVRILEQQRRENQQRYLDGLQHTHTDVHPYTVENLDHGSTVLLNACLQADGLAAGCDVLTRVEGASHGGHPRYEPTLGVGTHSIGKEHKLALAFAGYVLGRLQHTPPLAGRLIAMDGTSHTMKLDPRATDFLPLLDALHAWTTDATPEPPPIILNKHCPLCPFQQSCQAQAEQEDNLSLLHSVTGRVLRQYEKKGIFTVKQLSYLYKLRKPKKRSRKPPPVTFKVELQALAIREQKIYLHAVPALSRQPVELFLDIEGIPDRGLYYLIGLLVVQENSADYTALWADTAQEECRRWQHFLEKAHQYPDAPLYHYGTYEPRAIATLAKRYATDTASISKRLVDVHRTLYGQVYFPVRSNSLKDIGHFLGARWTAPNASGLQSLVWRHHWEQTREAQYREFLERYNSEDCQALRLVLETLTTMQHATDTMSEVDFVDTQKPRLSALGQHISSQLKAIVQFAHFHYDQKKIRFRLEPPPANPDYKLELHRRKAAAWRQTFLALQRRAKRIVVIPPDRAVSAMHRATHEDASPIQTLYH